MEVPLLTVEQVNRVVAAGFHVCCVTPSGIIGRVLAAREQYTRRPPALPPGVTVGPDVPHGTVLTVKVDYGIGRSGRHVGWCVPRAVWAEDR